MALTFWDLELGWAWTRDYGLGLEIETKFDCSPFLNLFLGKLNPETLAPEAQVARHLTSSAIKTDRLGLGLVSCLNKFKKIVFMG